MKILLLTSKFPQYKEDPQPAFTYYLARELVNKGHLVHVLAPHSPKAKKQEVIDGINVYRFQYFFPKSLQKLAYGSGIPANVRTSLFAKMQMPFFVFSEIIKAKEIVKRINPDVVHAHWGFPQGLAALLTGRKYINTIYGGEVFLSKKFKLVWLLDKIIEKSAKSFALTNGLKKIMREFGFKSDIDIMPLGVDTKKFNKNIDGSKIKKKYCPNKELMILTVARLVEKKGVDYLIKAFKKVKKEIDNVKLVIVGDGYIYDQLINLRKKLGLEKDVIFTKEINHEKLPSYYAAADLFVMPSIIDSTGNRETQGVVFLEAMACGTAVIGTDSGGIPDVISNEKVGILVPEKNSERLAEEMVRMLEDKNIRKGYSENGYKHVQKNFRWDKIAGKYLEVYEQIFAAKNPGHLVQKI